MIRLYHNDMSVCAAKIRMVLAEKALEWEGVHLDIRAGDAQRADYLKLNPNAVVPTLVHDDRVVIESTVIGEYLEDTFPAPRLTSTDSFERARMRLWTKQLDEGLHAAVGNLSWAIAFRQQFLTRSAEQLASYYAGIPSVETRERRRAVIEQGMAAPSFMPSLERWDRFMADAEAVLGTRPWLAGETFSLADIGFAPYLMRLEHLGLETLWERRPHTSAWRKRVMARPAFEVGITRWLNPKYVEIFASQRPAVRERLAAR